MAGAAQAQLPLPVHVVPLVARSTQRSERGLSTELDVANLGVSAATVGLAFFPRGREGVFTGSFPVTGVVLPGETKPLGDAVARAFGGPDDREGWLLVADVTPVECSSQDRPYPALLAVSARLRGSAGSSEVPASWLNLNVAQLPSLIVGVPAGAGERLVELGAANVSRQTITLRLVTRGAGGLLLGQTDRVVPALSLGLWSLAELHLPPPPVGGHLEVVLADDANAFNPCRVASSQPPCIEPCDRHACPQRYGFPGFPAFVAFALVSGGGAGPHYLPAVTDQVGAMRFGTEYRQRHCEDSGGLARVVDVFTRLALLRDPRTITGGRGPEPRTSPSSSPPPSVQAR